MADGDCRAAVAERAARAGGEVALASFRADVAVETKANRNDLVTAADREAQRRVVETIREAFPDDAFILEETPGETAGADGGSTRPLTVDRVPAAGSAWIVDPIDGTSNFVRETHTWTTSVAAVVDGETVGAATVLPAVDDAYVADADGVERGDASMRVSDRSDPETFAVAAVGGWDRTGRTAFADLAAVAVERFGDLRRIGSFQATLAHVAAGGLDAAIDPVPARPWDTVAGVHLIRRAGGTVTDVTGDRWEPAAGGLVASNGLAHDAVLAAARAAREAE